MRSKCQQLIYCISISYSTLLVRTVSISILKEQMHKNQNMFPGCFLQKCNLNEKVLISVTTSIRIPT